MGFILGFLNVVIFTDCILFYFVIALCKALCDFICEKCSINKLNLLTYLGLPLGGRGV